MKTRILLWIALSFFGLTIASAQQAPNKSKKVEFAVGGNCEQCKAHLGWYCVVIEKVSLQSTLIA